MLAVYKDSRQILLSITAMQASTWFCKPEGISAAKCALNGWINTATDTLQCSVSAFHGLLEENEVSVALTRSLSMSLASVKERVVAMPTSGGHS